MDNLTPTLIAGLIGVAGTLLGASVNEWLRRSNRIEGYASKVFEKRLQLYDHLYKMMLAGADVAEDVMTNGDYSRKERHEKISEVIVEIARFTDANQMYLDPDLGPHCIATFMGAEDVFDEADEHAKNEAKAIIRSMNAEARRMIREDSGMAQIDRIFKRVAKPVITSAVIDRIRELKREQRKRVRE